MVAQPIEFAVTRFRSDPELIRFDTTQDMWFGTRARSLV